MKNLIVLVFIWGLLSCDNSFTVEIKPVDNKHLAIRRILDSSTEYATQEVWVKGLSSDTTKTPLGSMYQLTDATGSIWVLTDNIPKENTRVYLLAKVETLFSFREGALGLHLVEIKRELQ